MKHYVDYQIGVDKGKLTAVANFEKLTFRAVALRRSKVDIKIGDDTVLLRYQILITT